MIGRPIAATLLPAWLCMVAAASAADAGKQVLIATWRGCEDACRGFQDYLVETGNDISFILRDAGQDKGHLAGILAEARASEVDLILSWGTTATQALAGTLADVDDARYNHDIPQVFMIVADPVGSGIVASLDNSGRRNVTGTYNRMPESVTIDTIRNYLPSFRRLGVLYNENEPNSVLKKQELEALAAELGFDLVALPLAMGDEGLPLPEDISPKMRDLAEAGVDFVYVGSSSFLQANSAILGSAALNAGLPLLSPYEDMVRNGDALISVAARYYDIGRLAGQQAEAILFQGSEAGDIPITKMKDFAVTLNMSVARELGLIPPIDLLQIADIVE